MKGKTVEQEQCLHPPPLTGGVCSSCGVETCKFQVSGCRCSVGYPYEEQCPNCRDREERMDDGYCVCRPSSTPPRPGEALKRG